MARVVGLVGGLRGKLGNTVFFVSGGQQVARVYQPVVFNPNSPLQIAQRAKMALVGRLSKIVPIAALDGLDGENRRARRGAFVAEAIKASTYTNNQAALSFENLKLSRGNVQFSVQATATLVSTTDYVARIDINLSVLGTAALPTGVGMRAVVFMIDSTNSDRDLCATKLCTMPTVGAAATTSVSFRLSRGAVSTFTPVVYLEPFRATEQLDGVNYSFVGTDTETFVLVDGLRSEAKITYGDSIYVATTVSREGGDEEEKKSKK